MRHGVTRRETGKPGTRNGRPRRATAMALLAIVALVSACSASGGLQAALDPGDTVTIGLDRLAVGSAGSVGHGVCATTPGVRLSAVSPISVSGGAELIGGAEIVAPAFSERVGAVYGFPPPDIETEPLGTNEIPLCDDRDTEAQIVFGVQHPRPGDGVIEGLRIFYVVNGTERSVDVPGFMITVSSEG